MMSPAQVDQILDREVKAGTYRAAGDGLSTYDVAHLAAVSEAIGAFGHGVWNSAATISIRLYGHLERGIEGCPPLHYHDLWRIALNAKQPLSAHPALAEVAS